MARTISGICLIVLLYTGSNAQLTNCRHVAGCNTSQIGTACYVNIDYVRCDTDALTTKKAWCYNTGCKRNCTCECLEAGSRLTGYGFSWCMCPGDILVSQVYECRFC